ncbi:hypothetical protein Vretimale_15452 [Volvox reticuliferus]|uniref:RAP domain-containing protein n=1 Tax=Volvox reticuliferus TaxID=1737510 RepID=A0A8J4GQV8_9CHLO|nr:hypothetical protein Vretimale_15452 [Volvox reticuliferus]
MWRTRGPRPCRGLRCYSTSRIIIRRAVKSQLHDGLVGADPSSSHVDQSRSGFGVQVSIQERPAAGDSGECSCDSEPSTSARIGDSSLGNRRWRNQHAMNSRDAAAITRRITHTQSTCELQAVVRQYLPRLNPIHISAAIVKLAKLTAGERGRQRLRQGLRSRQGQQQQWLEPTGQRLVVATGSTASSEQVRTLGRHPRGFASPSGSMLDAEDGAAPAAAVDALHYMERRGYRTQDEGQMSSSSSNCSSSSNNSGRMSCDTSTSGVDVSSLNKQDQNRRGPDQHDTYGSYPSSSGKSAVASSQIHGDIPAAQLRLDHVGTAAAAAQSALDPSALLADLVSGFLTQLPHYTSRQYANVVWALGSMGNRDHPELLQAAATQLQAQGGAKLFAAPPQELSNLALGLAKLGYREVSLWAAIIAAGKTRLHEFKPQELHNLAWAVAAASQDRSMISAAVQAALPQLRQFNASGLSNLLWACATAQCHCEELFNGAAAALMALPVEAVNYQDVANTAWACAKLQHNHPQLMAHLARLLLASARASGGSGLREAATQELVNTLWAFAVLPLPLSLPVSLDTLDGQQLRGPADNPWAAPAAAGGTGGSSGDAVRGLHALGLDLGSNLEGGVGLAEGQHRPNDPRRQGHWSAESQLPNASTHPSSTAGLNDAFDATEASGPPAHASSSTRGVSSLGGGGSASESGSGSGLLENVAQVLVSEVCRRADLTPQGVANALWACARLQPCPLPPAALGSLLNTATRCCGRMNEQEISNTLWAISELRNAGSYVSYDAVGVIFAAACGATRLEAMSPAGLAQLVQAAVALRRVSTGDMDVLAQHVLRRLRELGPLELCVVAAAAAEAVRIAKYCNPILLNGLANAAVACVGELCPQGISTLLWSFARAKHYHGPLTTILCRAAKPRLREFSDMEISNLVWALAVLKCQDRQLLIQAARVLVERVRLRRHRRAAGIRRHDDLVHSQRSTSHWQQQQHRDDLHRRFASVSDEAPGTTEAEVGKDEDGQRQVHQHQHREEQQAQLLDERTDMALTLASHRHQQRRRRQHQHQQQQRQSREGESQLVEAAPANDGQARARSQGGGDGGEELTGPKLWHRAGWEGCGRQQVVEESCATSCVAISTVSAAMIPEAGDGDSCSSTLAATVAVLTPTSPPPPESPDELLPEPRLRMRRLTSLHHNDDVDLALQPRRPPPRDGCGDAVDARRRGSVGTVGAAVTGPRCTVSLDSGGGGGGSGVLPQRAASSTDDADCSARFNGDDGAGSTPCDHAKSMAKLLWSYAKCSLYNQSLFRLLVQELQPVLPHTSPHELALSLWAVACHGHRCPEFLDAAAILLLRGRLRHLCAWDASVVAWAYAKLGHQHRGLFEALQEHARAVAPKYNDPCLLRLAWACAEVEVPLKEDLMRRVVVLKHEARRRVAPSTYDGTDWEIPVAADAARVE